MYYIFSIFYSLQNSDNVTAIDNFTPSQNINMLENVNGYDNISGQNIIDNSSVINSNTFNDNNINGVSDLKSFDNLSGLDQISNPYDNLDNMLYDAVLKGDFEGVRRYVNMGANINSIDNNGNTIIYRMALQKELSMDQLSL